MATQTPNLGLVKPADEEFYDIQIQNQNMDKLDQAVNANDVSTKDAIASIDDSDYIPVFDTETSSLKKSLWGTIKTLLSSVFVLKTGDTMTGTLIAPSFKVTKKATGTTLLGDVKFDSLDDKFRIFENGGTSRGVYISLTNAAPISLSKVYHSEDKPTPAEIGAIASGTVLPSSVNLNTICNSGFYRLSDTPVNGPSGVSIAWSQLMVCYGGGDTLFQIAVKHDTGEMFVRSAYGGGFATWMPWMKVGYNLSGTGTIGATPWYSWGTLYYQDVPAANLIESDNVDVGFTPNLDTASTELIKAAWNSVVAIYPYSNFLRVCVKTAPSVNIPITWRVVR